jgi:hypothetical protein
MEAPPTWGYQHTIGTERSPGGHFDATRVGYNDIGRTAATFREAPGAPGSRAGGPPFRPAVGAPRASARIERTKRGPGGAERRSTRMRSIRCGRRLAGDRLRPPAGGEPRATQERLSVVLPRAPDQVAAAAASFASDARGHRRRRACLERALRDGGRDRLSGLHRMLAHPWIRRPNDHISLSAPNGSTGGVSSG